MKKRSLSILLTLALLISMIPFTAIPAFAYEGDEYFTFREWDGTEVISFDDIPLSDFEPLTEITDTTSALGSGWYVVKGENVVISDSLTINGTAGSIDNATNIILMDGACLTVQKGINIQYGKSLIIYGQRNESGRLVAYGENNGAAIGGSGSFGSLTVNGGTVEATGNTYGTGIGGGYNGDGGTVVINGGKVIATGADGAGIGGGVGRSGGTVDIHGGIVEASSVSGGAGIGGGSGGNGANVTITGGIVTATGYSTGIGGGYNSSSHGSLSIYYDAYIMAGSEAPGSHVGLEQYLTGRDAYISINAPSEEGHTYSLWSASLDDGKNTWTLAKRCDACGKIDRTNPIYTNDLTGYVVADHIDVTDGVYMDTGYHPTNNTRVVMDVTVNGTTEYWFGVWDNDYNNRAFGLGNDFSGVYVGYMNRGGTDRAATVSPRRHRVELNKNEVFVDGVKRETIKFDYDNTPTTLNNSLYLFAQNRKGIAYSSDGQKITCHSCEIYENGELKHYYIPYDCGVESGLFDLVEGSAHTFIGHEWKINDGETHICDNCKQVEAHYDKDSNGYCDACGYDALGSDRDILYLNKTVDEETGKVTTEEKHFTGRARSIVEGDTVWGHYGFDSWLILDDDITLYNRPQVRGNVHLILLNGCTLTANHGITVENNNSLIIYAQSDIESEMGRLNITAPKDETAIGGRRGSDFTYDPKANIGGKNGAPGVKCGNVTIAGGKIIIETNGAVGIGGGNGGHGYGGIPGFGGAATAVSIGEEGFGGDGGNGGAVYFLDGFIDINNRAGACIGGGNAGNGGYNQTPIMHFGGNGGTVCFYGRSIRLSSESGACISGGDGGYHKSEKGGGESDITRKFHEPGQPATIIIGGTPVIKAGENEQESISVTAYDNQKYFSVTYIPGENSGDPINPFNPGDHTHSGSLQRSVTPSGKTVTYYKCDCGKYFEDAACTKEITDLNAWLSKGDSEDKSGTIIQTGDTSNMTPWIVLMIVSLMGLAFWIVSIKRKVE